MRLKAHRRPRKVGASTHTITEGHTILSAIEHALQGDGALTVVGADGPGHGRRACPRDIS